MPIYRMNFRAQETSGHRTTNSLELDIADDATANAVGAAVAAGMAAKLCSIMKQDMSQNKGQVHPEGTRLSAKVYLRDDGGNVQKLNFRNVNGGKTSADIASVFVGNCNIEAAGTPCTGASVTINQLPGTEA